MHQYGADEGACPPSKSCFSLTVSAFLRVVASPLETDCEDYS